MESVRAGMTLAQPVLHPERDDLMLLAAGYTLDDPSIFHLRELGLSHAWISFPGLDELDKDANPRIALGHMDLLQVMNRSVSELERRVSVKVNLPHYQRAVHRMLGEIIADADHRPVTHQLAACGPTLTGHLANTAYLSLLIGAHLAGYLRAQRRTLPPEQAENTAQLGLGALLHDIGKVMMPDDLQCKHILDPESAWPEYRGHVQTGYDEVREHVPPVTASVVLHHHQRYDGTGFPVKRTTKEASGVMEGTRIHVFSRIVAVADAFDHLMCPQGRPLPTVMALHQIRQPRFKGWFDPIVLEALRRLIPPFMVGSMVTLSDGSQAAVVTNHAEAPCRPTVRILTKPPSSHDSRAARLLDLRMCRNIGVAMVDGIDVRQCIYSGDTEPQGALAGMGAAFDAA